MQCLCYAISYVCRLRAHVKTNRSTSNTYLRTGGQGLGGASRGSVIHKEAADLMDGLSEHLLIASDTIRLLDTLGQGQQSLAI